MALLSLLGRQVQGAKRSVLGVSQCLDLELRQCPRVHLKTVLIDGQFCYLGSANWTGLCGALKTVSGAYAPEISNSRSFNSAGEGQCWDREG